MFPPHVLDQTLAYVAKHGDKQQASSSKANRAVEEAKGKKMEEIRRKVCLFLALLFAFAAWKRSWSLSCSPISVMFSQVIMALRLLSLRCAYDSLSLSLVMFSVSIGLFYVCVCRNTPSEKFAYNYLTSSAKTTPATTSIAACRRRSMGGVFGRVGEGRARPGADHGNARPPSCIDFSTLACTASPSTFAAGL